MTDPQLDIPCRDCETEGPPTRLDDDGLCPDCRTPAARLVAALCEMGVAGDHIKITDEETVEIGALTVDVWDGGAFTIHADGHYSVAAGYTAADAIAAIVQAPGLRKECDNLDAEVARLKVELERLRAHNARMGALLNKVADAMDDAEHEAWDDGAEIVTNALPAVGDLRALAAGEVDDG